MHLETKRRIGSDRKLFAEVLCIKVHQNIIAGFIGEKPAIGENNKKKDSKKQKV